MVTIGTVICTYKRPQILEQCLTHWCQSECIPDQFIVVDATPQAEKHRSQLIEKFPLLFSKPDNHYIVVEKPGLTAQRNVGLKALKTDIACFADDDAFISRFYLLKVLEIFQGDRQKVIGGVNGVAKGQFDRRSQKYGRLVKNYFRHHYGSFVQRIHIPQCETQLQRSTPLSPEVKEFPLIHIDRLWGANMNYRTELIYDRGFDESFQRYGLFEDVEMSVWVGKTHKLVCRLDAEIQHDDLLGQSTRPNETRYFLSSWLNSAYIIEKLFPCQESRSSHQQLFELIRLIAKVTPESFRDRKFKTLGNPQLQTQAKSYVAKIQACSNLESLQATFVQLQEEIYHLEVT